MRRVGVCSDSGEPAGQRVTRPLQATSRAQPGQVERYKANYYAQPIRLVARTALRIDR